MKMTCFPLAYFSFISPHLLLIRRPKSTVWLQAVKICTFAFVSLTGPWKRSGVVYRPSCVQERHCRPFIWESVCFEKAVWCRTARSSAIGKAFRDANGEVHCSRAHGPVWWLIHRSACLTSFKANNILIFPSFSLKGLRIYCDHCIPAAL